MIKQIDNWYSAEDMFMELGINKKDEALSYLDDSDKKMINGELYLSDEGCHVMALGYVFEDWS